jgi:hypothetical protein
MPGEVKSDIRVAPLARLRAGAFRHANFGFGPTQKAFFWPLLGVRLHSKTSSFLIAKEANFFLSNKSLGSFPLFSIFFHFPRLFPLAGPL